MDAAALEFAHGAQPETGGGVALLIRQYFDIAKARAVVDGDMGVFPTLAGARDLAMAGNPMAGSGESAEFLDIDMDQLTGALPFVALNRLRRAQIAQPTQADSYQHGADRGTRQRQSGGD